MKKNEYVGDWVDVQEKSNGLEYTMMDCVNHPLNEKPQDWCLNAPAEYWRHPDYPFWVSEQNIDIKKVRGIDEVSIEDFVEAMYTSYKEKYMNLCYMWDRLSDKEDMAEKILSLSKTMM